jgi:hypothetical protein
VFGTTGNKSGIGANISCGTHVYRGIRDVATALTRGLAGVGRGTETTEVTMFAGRTKSISKRFGVGRPAGQPAGMRPVHPMRL